MGPLDRNSGATYQLAPGDRLRLFDRVHDAEAGGRAKVLASNGDVVTVLALTKKGMWVRNDQGQEPGCSASSPGWRCPSPRRRPSSGGLCAVAEQAREGQCGRASRAA
jgi:hypothetical protein